VTSPSDLRYNLTRLRSMPMGAIASAVALRCRKRLVGSLYTRFPRLKPPAARVGHTGKLTLLNPVAPELAGFPLHHTDAAARAATVAALERHFPEARQHTIEAAEQYCDHVFNLLGSGVHYLGHPIDWHVDVKSGKRWPLKHRAILHYVDLDDDSDYRVPWELSRFQHLSTLGKAYWYTADEKYAGEFVDSVSDWIAANPVEFGVNWTCAMEAAIRAVNWIWAFGFFSHSARVVSFGNVLASALVAHGRFIEANLEYHTVDGTKFGTNHLLCGLVGLLYIAAFLPDCPDSGRWRDLASGELFREVERQFRPDGGNFEASTRYHGLSLELILVALRLCRALQIEVPPAVADRTEAAVEYTLYYTRPDGSVPQIGDCDDGVLLSLASTPPGEFPPASHRHLLALGSLMFRRADFARAAGTLGEYAFWFTGPPGLNAFESLVQSKLASPLGSRLFPMTGVCIMRKRDRHMLVDVGPNGQGGLGGHAHNDTLSFELFAGDSPFIIDPGTYCYTSDCLARDTFRSTAAHNTVVVDGVEINPIDPRRPFFLAERAVASVTRWSTEESRDCLTAEHRGYSCLRDPVTHSRTIVFDKTAECWLVCDQIVGSGTHLCELYFHAAPGLVASLDGTSRLILPAASSHGLLVMPLETVGLVSETLEGWVSPRYGVRVAAPVLRYTRRGRVPLSFVFLLFPFERASGLPDAATLRALGTRLLNSLADTR
jgi:uncharacterized heparinase superfamily protein